MFGNKSIEKAETLAHQALPLMNKATEQASALLHSGVESVQDMSRQLRDKTIRASHCTVNYVKDEPVKAMLIAAAAGAAIVVLTGLISHKRDRR